ncbi:hypothetical protein PQG02_06165 [Nostoc sp. UHCC 0926]|uniref:hypothetical protein n=1 Tax=Nostoc sp. TaxID=1180 RepID=UPI0027988AD7|nr:hypothetical protein PQG02_06165 [Nostoc sp. UHCC 0926]
MTYARVTEELNRRGTEKPVRWAGFPTCTPTGKQATRSVSLRRSNWRDTEV